MKNWSDARIYVRRSTASCGDWVYHSDPPRLRSIVAGIEAGSNRNASLELKLGKGHPTPRQEDDA